MFRENFGPPQPEDEIPEGEIVESERDIEPEQSPAEIMAILEKAAEGKRQVELWVLSLDGKKICHNVIIPQDFDGRYVTVETTDHSYVFDIEFERIIKAEPIDQEEQKEE